VCPLCGGEVEYAGITAGYIFPGVNTAQSYVCKRCGYTGALVLEVDSPELPRLLEREYLEGKAAQPSHIPGRWTGLWRLLLVLFLASLLYTLYAAL